MKRFFILISLIFINVSINAQQLLDDEKLKHSKTYINLQEAISDADNVYKLELVSYGLDTLPKEISKLKKLQVINLSCNMLENLPEEFGELTNLQKNLS